MLGAPWDIILTIAFAFTAVVCVGDLALRRSRLRSDGDGLADNDLIDINHGVMSVAMIAMIWWFFPDVVTWAQMLLFAVLALSLVPLFARSASASRRLDLGGHIVLDGAMIWMLGAMPLLMAGSVSAGSGGAHAHHGGDDAVPMLQVTPIWADVVNLAFIAMSAALAIWWLLRLVTARGHRLHLLCHAVMAAGMAGMLVLMNL